MKTSTQSRCPDPELQTGQKTHYAAVTRWSLSFRSHDRRRLCNTAALIPSRNVLKSFIERANAARLANGLNDVFSFGLITAFFISASVGLFSGAFNIFESAIKISL